MGKKGKKGTSKGKGEGKGRNLKGSTKVTTGDGASTASDADAHKARGNAAYGRKEWDAAIECYSNAIKIDNTNHVYFSNRSAAYLAKGGCDRDALKDAEQCISLAPMWAKGYMRKGDALARLKGKGPRANALLEAQMAYRTCLDRDPSKATETKVKRCLAALEPAHMKAARRATGSALERDCAQCNTPGATLTCARCKATSYCDKKCQRAHWHASHKRECASIRPTPKSERPALWTKLEERTSDLHGKGVFALADCDVGEVLLDQQNVSRTDWSSGKLQWIMERIASCNASLTPPWSKLLNENPDASDAAWEKYLKESTAAAHIITKRVPSTEPRAVHFTSTTTTTNRPIRAGEEVLRDYGWQWLPMKLYHFRSNIQTSTSAVKQMMAAQPPPWNKMTFDEVEKEAEKQGGPLRYVVETEGFMIQSGSIFGHQFMGKKGEEPLPSGVKTVEVSIGRLREWAAQVDRLVKTFFRHPASNDAGLKMMFLQQLVVNSVEIS